MARDAELFDREELPTEGDDKLPSNQWRKCGWCREEFWSQVIRARPAYVPLHCTRCDKMFGEDLRRRTEIFRAKIKSGELRWKKKSPGWEKNPEWGKPLEKIDMGDVADILIGERKRSAEHGQK